ncbi:ribonuclease H-like domain-containing protein [Mycena galericulata]|nr:ribonuclease H-like domain-containing protein [Mycena galericulata]
MAGATGGVQGQELTTVWYKMLSRDGHCMLDDTKYKVRLVLWVSVLQMVLFMDKLSSGTRNVLQATLKFGRNKAVNVGANAAAEFIDVVGLEHPPFELRNPVQYLTTRRSVNRALAFITDGVVGFDTEFVPKMATSEDEFIDAVIAKVGGNRKTVVTVLRAIDLSRSRFKIAWHNIGLCVVQIARGDDVWVINLSKIKAYPAELRRILESPDIVKTGVGILSDIQVVWSDLGSEMNNLVDGGLMARLLLAEKYADTAYSNLSMAVSVREILGAEIDKEMGKSNWKGESDNDLTSEQIKYAAIDAVASLRLYEALGPALVDKSAQLNLAIPAGWYSFNSSYGEPTRTQLTHQGKVALWSTRETCTWFFGGKFQGYY